MYSLATNGRTKGRLKISDAGPSCGSMKLTAATTFAVLTLTVLALLLFFALPARAQEAVVYNFTGGSDGGGPQSSLILDSAGNLYGTTYSGGLWGYGTVYELSPNGNDGWNPAVLYSFTGGADGGNPTYAYLMFDSAGNLYGTAYNGGANGLGVVFELSPVGASWTETVLHSFAGGADGANPVNGLLMDGSGNLYGKTYAGGNGNNGVVFELMPSGVNWTNQVLATLFAPSYSGLAWGNWWGWGNTDNIYFASYDNVGVLKPNGSGGWTEYNIAGFSDHVYHEGYGIAGTPVVDGSGNVYVTTQYGGSKNIGTVYVLTPVTQGRHEGEWTKRLLHSFIGGATDGAMPVGGLLFGDGAYFFGTTLYGGANGQGTIFSLISNDWISWYFGGVTWSFNAATGDSPNGSLIWSAAGFSSGNVFGTAAGGSARAGVVFEANATAALTTTTSSTSPNPSAYGQPVTLTARVSCPGGASFPSGGTVTFVEHGTVLGTTAMNNGYASSTISTLKVGTAIVEAVFSGDWNLVASTSKTVKQVVGKATTTTALASSLNPSNIGQSVTFTASVVPQFSGEATGTVTFYDGTTVLGSKGVKGGAAAFTTSKLTSGTHTITAAYNGSTGFTGSSASLTQTVN
ncbi:MAG: choice-of-anchor tandem repeat GloVer-containing protein [Candidatus Korobacteraceae bacterium]